MKNKLFILLLTPLLTHCHRDIPDLDFKQEMRDFVIQLSEYARGYNTSFIIIPQNGQELVTENGEENGSVHNLYLSAISGQGREDLYYGYDDDNKSTPKEEYQYMENYLDKVVEGNKVVLVTDYCWTESKMDDSYQRNLNRNYISFAANHRGLDNIPTYPAKPFNENNSNITNLNEAKNFLYLIDPTVNFTSKTDFINKVSSTNYDAIIMDIFWDTNDAFSKTEIAQLKTKQNGGSRLVIAYMSIGEAEDYRYYWRNDWKKGDPSFLYKENKDWDGNFKVKYWQQNWHDVIYGNDNSYLKKIIDADFDGAYLDIIDAFEYFDEIKN